MLYKESLWYQQRVHRYIKKHDVVLNIGSSTRHFREKIQPHIYQNVLHPIEKQGAMLHHVDLKAAEGVDLVGDVTDAGFVQKLNELTPKAAICSNLLEHLTDRKSFCAGVTSILPAGAILFVSVPYEYPYHADPIDTLFRPTVEELVREFEGMKLLEGEIVPCGTLKDKHSYDRRVNPARWYYFRFRAYIRLLMPFYRPKAWLSRVDALRTENLPQPVSVTCVVLQK